MRGGQSNWIGRAVVLTAVTMIFCSPAVAQTEAPPETPGKPSAELQEVLKTCFECHGPGGVSNVPSRPTIAGQKPEYLRRQLLAFKNAADGHVLPAADDLPARTDPVMSHMADTVPRDLITPLAAALSSMACNGGEPKPASARTYSLPQAGGVCVSCHGRNGIGAKPRIPNLAGQPRSYLRRQLLLIRETAWGAQPRENEAWRSHPIMEAQAARLSISDIDAIAQYYSALPCTGTTVQPETPK